MMTKEQEKATLDKIAKLIASAGPDSYIGMAFTGCVEMARDNIENDFGNSLQERAERAEKDLDKIHRQVTSLSSENTRLREALAAMAQAEQMARNAQIPAGLYKRLWLSIDEQHTAAMNAMDQCTEHLAELADHPGDIAVANGLKILARQRAKRDEAAALLSDLERYEPENA